MRTVATIALLTLLIVTEAVAQGPASQPSRKPAVSARGTQSDSGAGEQVFRRNCSRCHKAPEAIPPSVAGTVALHMRIRAGLSEKDYRRLLAFLNP